MKGRSAFTLLELMVAVNVIGILASIAIPGYFKFRIRAKQVSAKALLAQAFVAEKSIYAEFGQYAGCFCAPQYGMDSYPHANPGFNFGGPHPNGTGSAYAVGGPFLPGPGGEAFTGNLDLQQAGVQNCSAPNNYLPASIRAEGYAGPLDNYQNLTASIVNNQGLLTKTSFQILSAAQYASGVNRRDIWSINESKAVMQISSPE